MADVRVYDANGAAAEKVSLRDDVYGVSPNTALLHQAVVRQLADARLGTHDTKTRGEVKRTTKKAWRQKGTGRARQGARSAPHWTGGGVVFGPHPRSYRQDLPKKMRAGALRSALAAKTADGELVLIQEISLDVPSTKTMARVFDAIAPGQSALLILDAPNRMVQLSTRNLPQVKTITVENVNVYDLLRFRRVVLSVNAARILEERYGRYGVSAERGAEETGAEEDGVAAVAAVPGAPEASATAAAAGGVEAVES
ncbi:MAG: 50S ribosomal protein L4 [Chloroflexi bacterium]|nr:50S ribosomal protein L4 [Chloroflexota bacterium]